MKTYDRFGALAIAAALFIMAARPAFADAAMPTLPGPGTFGLVAAGIAAAVWLTRRSR